MFAGLDEPKSLRDIVCEHDYVNDEEVIEKVEGVMGEFLGTHEN